MSTKHKKIEYNYNQKAYNKYFYAILKHDKLPSCLDYINPAHNVKDILALQKIDIFKTIDKDNSDLVYQYVLDKNKVADAYTYLAKNKAQLLPQFDNRMIRILKINPMDYPHYTYKEL